MLNNIIKKLDILFIYSKTLFKYKIGNVAIWRMQSLEYLGMFFYVWLKKNLMSDVVNQLALVFIGYSLIRL